MGKEIVEGYKCFNKGLICNQNGFKMEPKKIYRIDDNIKFRENGFHFCVRLEDTLRFFGNTDDEKEICKIKALGDIYWSFDEYNGYYDMGCTNEIYIDRVLTREEIFKYADKLTEMAFSRFVMGYKLNNDELLYFKEKYKNDIRIMGYLKYYQEKDIDAFNYNYKKILKK